MISAMRSKWPTRQILVVNTYLEAAYRRIHVNEITVLTSKSIVDETDFICLRLTFVTKPAPVEYTTVSKAAIYLEKNLLRDEYWDTDYLN